MTSIEFIAGVHYLVVPKRISDGNTVYSWRGIGAFEGRASKNWFATKEGTLDNMLQSLTYLLRGVTPRLKIQLCKAGRNLAVRVEEKTYHISGKHKGLAFIACCEGLDDEILLSGFPVVCAIPAFHWEGLKEDAKLVELG